jgi:PHD/YefM family antitoxin component YafN of YafNO toxin-antitoxin module
MYLPQIEPVTTLSKDYKSIFSKLNKGPVVLAMRSRPAAVLLSVGDYEKMVTRLEQLELLLEAKRNLARAEAEPSTVIFHDELKQLLLEKRSQGTATRVEA